MVGLLLMSGPPIKLRVDKHVGLAPLQVKVSIVVPPHDDNRRIIFETACDGFPMEQAEIPLAGAAEQTSQYVRTVVLREPCEWTLVAALELKDKQIVLADPAKVEVR